MREAVFTRAWSIAKDGNTTKQNEDAWRMEPFVHGPWRQGILLTLADGTTELRQLATGRLISTRPNEKQNRVTELFDKYNLLALPVLEDDGSLAGVITADDVISVLREK